MAYRRSHYRKGHWRQTKNGPVWVSPTQVSGHNFNPNSLGNPYSKYSSSLPNPFSTPNSISSIRATNTSLTSTSTTLNPYSFHIAPEQYEEKYSEAKELFSMAKSSDDYLYVEAFFLGLTSYKNSQFYIDLCRQHYKSYLHYRIKSSIPIEKKNLSFRDTSDKYASLESKPSKISALAKQSPLTNATTANTAYIENIPSLSFSKNALNKFPESKTYDQSSLLYFVLLLFFILLLLFYTIANH